MPQFMIESFPHLLELSVSPIVLISGVGLLLISQTNRLARSIDRSRILAREIKNCVDAKEKTALKIQLRIMYRRCKILRTAITLLASSILCAGLMILLIAFISFFGLMVHQVAMVIFFLGISCLVGSILWFLVDIFLGLRALNLEVKEHLKME